MKKILMMMALATVFTSVYSQEFSGIDKSVMDAAYYPTNAAKRAFAKTDEDKAALKPQIRVLYSRPLKKGRTVFGDVVKLDKAWRIGANESTEILFMNPVEFGGTKVAPGRYSLIAIPSATEWTIKLNTGLDGWGNYTYDKSLDIASVTVPTQTSAEEIEALSIVLYEKSPNTVHLKIGWDTTVAEFPITIQ